MAVVTLHQASLGLGPQPASTIYSPTELDISQWQIVASPAGDAFYARGPLASVGYEAYQELRFEGQDLQVAIDPVSGRSVYSGTVTGVSFYQPVAGHIIGYIPWQINELSVPFSDVLNHQGNVIDLLLAGDDLITGHDVQGGGPNDGVNVLSGLGGNDTLLGLGGDDTLYGGDGDDLLNGGFGTNIVDGGAGTDTLVLYGNRADYDLDLTGPEIKAISKSGSQNTTATHIEKLYFTDSHEVVDLTAPGGPDTGGGSSGENKIFYATDAGGWLAGTSGNDTLIGGAGEDVLYGGAGDDAFIGGDPGYNQVNLDGAPADYRFFRANDGTVIVESDKFGSTDTMVQITGVFFEGAKLWYSVDDLIANTPAQPAQPIGETLYASPAGGWLAGTAGDDVLIGGAGEDVFYGGAGNDVFAGGDKGYNQVNLDGSAADYDFFKASDGTVIAASDTFGSTDTMFNITAIYFEGDSHWVAIDDLVG